MVKSYTESISSHKVDGLSSNNLSSRRGMSQVTSDYLDLPCPILAISEQNASILKLLVSPSDQVKTIYLPCIITQVIVESASYCRVLMACRVTLAQVCFIPLPFQWVANAVLLTAVHSYLPKLLALPKAHKLQWQSSTWSSQAWSHHASEPIVSPKAIGSARFYTFKTIPKSPHTIGLHLREFSWVLCILLQDHSVWSSHVQ